MRQNLVLQKLSALAICAALCAGTAGTATASNQDFYQQLHELTTDQDKTCFFTSMHFTLGSNVFKVDGEQRPLGAMPEVLNERTMLPIQELAKVIGATVTPDESTQTITIISHWGDKIVCKAGSSSMTVNGKTIQLDAPSYWKNGACYLPVRAIVEALYMEVHWNQETMSITITAPYQSARVIAYVKELDISAFEATKVITDGTGMWVLQFDTPAQAKAAVDHLHAQGITAGPDASISLF